MRLFQAGFHPAGFSSHSSWVFLTFGSVFRDSRRCWRHLVPASCPTYAAQIWRWKTSSLTSGRNFEETCGSDWRCFKSWIDFDLTSRYYISYTYMIHIYIYPRKNRILVQTLPTPFDLNFSKGPRSIAQIPYNWSMWVWSIGYDQVHIPPRISESRLWKFMKSWTVNMQTLPR